MTASGADGLRARVVPVVPMNVLALFFGTFTLTAKLAELGIDLSGDPELLRTFYLHCRTFPILAPIFGIMGLLALPAWLGKLFGYLPAAIRERESLAVALPNLFPVVGIPLMGILQSKTMGLVRAKEPPDDDVREPLFQLRVGLLLVALCSVASDIIVFRVKASGARWGLTDDPARPRVVRMREPVLCELVAQFFVLTLCLADWGVAVRGDEAFYAKWMEHRVSMPAMRVATCAVVAGTCCKLAAILVLKIPEAIRGAPGGKAGCVPLFTAPALAAAFAATEPVARLPKTMAAWKTFLVVFGLMAWLLELGVRNKGVTALLRAESEEEAIAVAASVKEEAAPGKTD